MNRITWVPALLVVVSLAIGGCGQSTEGPSAVGEAAEGGGLTLCGACGMVKGLEDCCKPDAEKCDDCGLVKGSPGCCKIEQGTDVKLCTKCGQIPGSDDCCDPDAPKCEKCGLAKGSPGCCKLGV